MAGHLRLERQTVGSGQTGGVRAASASDFPSTDYVSGLMGFPLCLFCPVVASLLDGRDFCIIHLGGVAMWTNVRLVSKIGWLGGQMSR